MKTHHGMLATAVLLGVSSLSWAGPVTCSSPYRTATLDSAQSCVTGPGNPGAPQILIHYPGAAWTDQGENAPGDGTTGTVSDDYLKITLTSGAWGGSNITADWFIAPSFWTFFGEAVISMHVGNGNGNPDYWAWLLTPGEYSGTLSYKDFDGQGGGLSNLRLWARAGSTTIPEPSSLALAAAGLLLISLRKRRKI